MLKKPARKLFLQTDFGELECKRKCFEFFERKKSNDYYVLHSQSMALVGYVLKFV